MRQGATITVGYDGTRSAGRALDWAADELEGRGGTLRVVACYGLPVTAEPWYVPPAVDVTTIRAEAQRLVDAAVASSAATHPSVRFEAVVSLGAAVDELVAQAAASDLLVVGTRGRGRLDAWRLGSVAHGVVRHATCPVAIVPDREPAPRRDRVTVGYDGSPTSLAALRWAADEADDRDAELLVVHAWEYGYATEVGSPTARDLTRVDAALTLEAGVRAARERRRGPVDDRLVDGRAASELIEEGRDADLLVVGSRGRSAVRSMLFGSVSQEVGALAPCPTVVVRDIPDRS